MEILRWAASHFLALVALGACVPTPAADPLRREDPPVPPATPVLPIRDAASEKRDGEAWTERTPLGLNLNDVGASLDRARAIVRSKCPLPAKQGRSLVKLVFSPDGSVRTAWLEYSPFPNTPTADCLLEIVRNLRSEPFSGPPFVMGADFLVGTDPGGNATFGNFDHAGAAAALAAASTDARSCLGAAPPVHVSLAVEAPGIPVEVTVDATGPVADCIREKMRALRVPPYTGLKVFLETVVRAP